MFVCGGAGPSHAVGFDSYLKLPQGIKARKRKRKEFRWGDDRLEKTGVVRAAETWR